MRIKLFFLLLFLPTFGQSQSLDGKDLSALRQRMLELINEYRLNEGVQPLQFNEILQKAAQNHSDYMSKTGNVDHFQKNSSMKTPEKRVKYFKGKDFEWIGENVLCRELVSSKLSDKLIISTAQNIFDQWRNSPDHNKNMLHSEYQLGDFGFSYNESKKLLYATNVFAKNKTKIEGQLSKNAFGIQRDEFNCEKLLEEYWNVLATIGNSLEVEGNEVVLYYHNLQLLTEILSGPMDGIAVDLIAIDQLACGSPNKMDGSTVYDGIMLKPTYINTILKNNRSESPFRVISTVGTIPESIPENEYQPTLILIKNNKACYNFNLVFVPAERLEVIPFSPILKNPEGELLTDGIIKTDRVEFAFNSDDIISENTLNYKKQNLPVHSLKIYSYSSVDGNQEHNSYLHTERATYIKKTLQNILGQSKYPVATFAEENWRKMYFQLEYNRLDSIAVCSKDSIKKFLAIPNNSLNWKTDLSDQRKSFALVNYYGKLPKNADTSAVLTLNLRTALAQNDINLVNKVLYLLYYQNNDISEVVFEDLVFEELLKNPELVQNASAVMSKYCANHLFEITEFASHWMRQKSRLSTEAKNNLLHLYSITGLVIIDKWDVSMERLAHVLHPSKVKELTGTHTPPVLMLNTNLVFIEYFGQINDSPNIIKAFEFVADYFSKVSLSQKQETDLVLFFNNWSMFDLTIDFLNPKFKNGNIEEEQLFILAHTIYLYSNEGVENDYIAIHRKAVQINKTRWCDWIKYEFLLLNNLDLKELYCKECGS